MRTRGITHRALANIAFRSRVLVVTLLFGLVAVPVTSLGSTHAATGGPTTEPAPAPGPRLLWQLAVDSVGNPMLADGTMLPVAIDGGPMGIVLAAEDGSEATRLWHSSDGVVWERLPNMPDPDTGARIRGLVAYAKGWVAHGADTAGDVTSWTSTDGIEWKRIAAAKLEPFDGAFIADIVSGGEGLVAIGRSIGDAENDRIWTSPNGRRWRERGEIARAHPGASLTTAGSMGYHFVTFGRAGTGKPAVWVGSDHTLNYITRQWRGSAPKDSAPPSALHVGRDAGLAVVASARSDGPPAVSGRTGHVIAPVASPRTRKTGSATSSRKGRANCWRSGEGRIGRSGAPPTASAGGRSVIFRRRSTSTRSRCSCGPRTASCSAAASRSRTVPAGPRTGSRSGAVPTASDGSAHSHASMAGRRRSPRAGTRSSSPATTTTLATPTRIHHPSSPG